MPLVTIAFYAAFASLGAVFTALAVWLLCAEPARVGALQYFLHRVVLGGGFFLTAANSCLCAFVYTPSNRALEVAIDVFSDAIMVVSDVGVAVISYSLFQSAMFSVGLEVRVSSLRRIRTCLIVWLSIEAIVYVLVNVLRPLLNLDAVGGFYYSYWCCGTLLGCSFATYAIYSLYHAMLPEFRPRLHSTIAFACAYTCSYAYFLEEHVRNVVFLFSNFSALAYFGHDRTLWHHMLLPIATTILLTIGSTFSLWSYVKASSHTTAASADVHVVAAPIDTTLSLPVAAPDTPVQLGRSSSPRRINDRLPSWIVRRGALDADAAWSRETQTSARLLFQNTATQLDLKGGETPLLGSLIDM